MHVDTLCSVAAPIATQAGSGVAYVYDDVAFLEGIGNTTFQGHAYSVPQGSSSLVNLTSGDVLFNTATLSDSARVSSGTLVAPALQVPLLQLGVPQLLVVLLIRCIIRFSFFLLRCCLCYAILQYWEHHNY